MSTKTIKRNWKVNGVLTSATSAVLSDATGAYGIKRDDTDAVVVAAGTAMTESATGEYEYSFTEPAAGLSYTCWVTITYNESVYRFEHDIPAVTYGEVGATYTNLQEALGAYLGYWTQADGWTIATASQPADLDALINRFGLPRFYLPPRIRPAKTGHQWSFLRPLTTLTMVAGTSAYDLPAGFAGLERDFTFAAGQTVLYRPIKLVPEQLVRHRLSEYDGTSRPELCGIRPKTADYTVGTRYEIIFYPSPDDAYELEYRYRISPQSISDENPYPLGGQEHALTITEACLAAAESFVNDRGGPKDHKAMHESLFMQQLEASIAHDQDLSCPDTMGYNKDYSDSPGRFWIWHNGNNITTHNDIAY